MKGTIVAYISPWAFICSIKANGIKPPRLLSRAALAQVTSFDCSPQISKLETTEPRKSWAVTLQSTFL